MAHNAQRHRGRELTEIRTVPRSRDGIYRECPIQHCDREVTRNGLCMQHGSIAYRMSVHEDDLQKIHEDFRCATCFEEGGVPNLDHDHECCPENGSCGECVRGAVCSSCNQLIARIERDIDTAKRIIDYLKDPPGVVRTKEFKTIGRDSHPGRARRRERDKRITD